MKKFCYIVFFSAALIATSCGGPSEAEQKQAKKEAEAEIDEIRLKLQSVQDEMEKETQSTIISDSTGDSTASQE